MKNVGILDFARSPISKAKKGKLLALTPLEIAHQVVTQLLARNEGLPLERIESVVCGTAYPEAEQGLNIGRQIAIKCGLPVSVAGITVNQFCASSQQAVMMLADAFACGKGDIGIAVGMEHMARIPQGGYNPSFDPELYEKNFYISMGDTAEVLAREGPISREDQEAFAMESHRKALAAWADGAFAREVVPIRLPDGSLAERDEFPREPDPEKIKSLKPAFDAQGTVTAATSSPISIGVGAAIVMTEEAAQALGVKLRATIEGTAVAGCDYERMGLGPIPATEKVLARTGLSLGDMDVIELNEAFAAQSLAVIRQGGWTDYVDRINVLGGALALGHPLGMSGVRIIGTAITALERCGGTYALATMCVGGGQGASTVLKRVGA
ncbi:MAG: thiolase family protein [Planctomycetota bacterium]|nr:MAG: thiolase family protein [Planctomycetota bacterium]